MMDAEATGHVGRRSRLAAKSKTRRRRESAQQAALAELLDPRPPALGVTAKSLEDGCKLGRDRGLAVADRVSDAWPAFSVKKLGTRPDPTVFPTVFLPNKMN